MNFEQMDKNRENINQFFKSLEGPGYQDKILAKYPNVSWEFYGDGELPSLTQTQVWCCDCGCGEKDPVLVPTLNRSVVSDKKTGDGLREGGVSGAWQSPCFQRGDDDHEHYGMFVWDYASDSEVPGIKLEGRW